MTVKRTSRTKHKYGCVTERCNTRWILLDRVSGSCEASLVVCLLWPDHFLARTRIVCHLTVNRHIVNPCFFNPYASQFLVTSSIIFNLGHIKNIVGDHPRPAPTHN